MALTKKNEVQIENIKLMILKYWEILEKFLKSFNHGDHCSDIFELPINKTIK